MAASRNRTPPDSALEEAVAGVLATAGVAPGQTICVALSGGVDSTVLLHALAACAERGGFRVRAAHVHHGLSPNADAWREASEAFAASLRIPFQSFEVRVDRAKGQGLEAAAREARHAALTRVPCDWLAFGHHQDDQAETLLFRLLRGTGVHGAGGMAPVERGRLRPLLDVRRADIVAYAEAKGLSWVDDESNTDVSYRRNLLRHRVFPLLEEAFPAAVPVLARASGNFREADGLLDELASLDREACGGARLELQRLVRLSDARLRNLLRHAMREAGFEAPARSALGEATRQLREAAGRPLRLALGEAALCVYRGQVWLERQGPAVAETRVWRGQCALAWGEGEVVFEPAVGEGLGRHLLRGASEITLGPRWPGLTLRQGSARPRRTFKNLCQEAGIPEWLRGQLPVLRVDGEAAWIAEVGVAVEFRCAPGEPGVLPVWRR